MSSTERIPALDGLRAISILLVLSAHMLPLGPKILELNDTAGAMGMSLFFALSGFLITETLFDNANVLEFMVRRLTRILPLAYAYSFLVFTFIHFDPTAALWTSTFLINYLTQYMTDGLNNHLWSLCVEMQFYVAIAIAVLVGGKKALWIVWPACLLVTALRVHEGVYIAIQTHLRVDEILVGAAVATLYKRQKKLFQLPMMVVGFGALCWLATASPYMLWLQYFRPYSTAIFLAAVLSQSGTWLEGLLGAHQLRYIAAVSYALYVVHPATMYGWLNQGDVMERYLLKRPISFAMTFILAHMSTFYWERLWMNAGRRWIEARRSRVAHSVS